MLGRRTVRPAGLPAALLLAAAVGALSFLAPGLTPWNFVALAGAAVLFACALRLDVTVLPLLWAISYGLLDLPEARFRFAGVFTMSIPRLLYLAMMAVLALHLLLRRRPPRLDRGIFWAMLALLIYCAGSAVLAGPAPPPPAGTKFIPGPYFRFLAAFLFPYLAFFMLYNCVRTEDHIRRALVLLSIYGWYAIYIAYLQYAAIRGLGAARELIWPAYINDPKIGIHFDRARGAFLGCNTQVIFLTVIFYGDLFLIRKLRGAWRTALVLQAVLIPPAVFFSGLRGGYLAFLVGGVVWCMWGCRGRLAKSKLAIGFLGLLILVAAFWSNVTGTERRAGGVAQVGPIRARGILLHYSMELFKSSPVVGAGFGRYPEAAGQLDVDPFIARASAGLGTPHNIFLVMLAETGLVGTAALVLVIVLLFRQSLQLYRKIPPSAPGLLSREFVVVFWVCLAAYLTDAMFVDPFWDIAGNALLWSMAGLMTGYNRLLDPQPLDLLAARFAQV